MAREFFKVKLITAPPFPAWAWDSKGDVFEVCEWSQDYILREDYEKGRKAEWRFLEKSSCERLK